MECTGSSLKCVNLVLQSKLHAALLSTVTAGFSQGSLYSSLEDVLTEPELQKKEKWPIRIATKHLVKPGEGVGRL